MHAVIRHWFFDFDGTLCDTEADIKNAWRATIRELGLDLAPFEELYSTGPSIDDMVRLMWPESADDGLIADVRAAFVRHYDASGFPLTEPYPGIVERLNALKSGGARIYIVTNKRYSATCALVDRLGWQGFFDDVYSSDKYKDGPIGKLRKPALLAQAMKEQGATAEDAVIVGDTHLDIEAGKANGLRTIGVTWGYGTREELEKACADEIKSEPLEI